MSLDEITGKQQVGVTQAPEDIALNVEGQFELLAVAVRDVDELVHLFAVRVGTLLQDRPDRETAVARVQAPAISSMGHRIMEQRIALLGLGAFLREIIEAVDLPDAERF